MQPDENTLQQRVAVDPPDHSHHHHHPRPPIPAAPSSGSSWSAWAGHIAGDLTSTMATNVSPAAAGMLEKAGQLAYSTVESANDLLVQGGSGSHDNLTAVNSGLGATGTGMMGNVVGGRLQPATMAVDPPSMAIDPPSVGSQSNNSGDGAAPMNLNDISLNAMVERMTVPSSKQSRTETAAAGTDSIGKGPHQQRQRQQEQNQHTRQNRASSNPPPSVLASRQSRLSILILPTAEAQSIAAKNNTSLPELFRIFGNLNSSRRILQGGRMSKDASLEPMLPPFRSANRSIALSWENIQLNFLSNNDMDHTPVGEGEGEKALGVAARLWDEDRIDASADGDSKETEEDVEMNQLEGYVVAALAEDEAEERARSEDGIPSMTSAPPSRRNSQQFGEAGDDPPSDGVTAEHHEPPFPPRPEEALENVSDAAFALTALPTSPWLLRFRNTLDFATDGMYHEMLCNPSVVILTASTSEISYVNCLAELANVHHLPRPYQDGRYDPNGLRREFLLLHDVVNGPKDFDESRALKLMRDRFGMGCCSILRINSLVPRTVAISDGYATTGEDDEWENAGPASPFGPNGILSAEYVPHVENSKKALVRGACLSPSDKRAIRRYVANMVATGLVPAIERRIAHLNASVSNAKKGMKNVIKSFWRKPKENLLASAASEIGAGGTGNRRDSGDHKSSELGSSGVVKYRYNSIESQTRLLADTLFLMRDYDAALGAYRLVKDDYKHDKAHLHYASVQEMMVLCMHMLDPSGRDGRYSGEIQHSIETSLYSYTRVSDEEQQQQQADGVSTAGIRPGKAPHATRLATRLCLALSSSRSLCDRRHMEIADLLASASSHETPLGAAVLLEQSAAHYHRAGMVRKYAFHMLMAGHMFRSAGGQERHAFRCFAASLYVYHGERWGELRSHLRSALAAQLYGMGRFALSMQFYAKLIGMKGGGRVSVRSQQKFLNHIVNVCKDHPAQALVAIDRMNSNKNNGILALDMAVAPRRGVLEDVMKGFADAVTRQIEISNIGFPHVCGSSISICVDGTENEDGSIGRNSCVSLGRTDSLPITADGGGAPGPSFGKGDEAVWQDMINCAEAELRSAVAVASLPKANSSIKSSSSHNDSHSQFGEDELSIDRVITAIDTEEREAEYRERAKKKGTTRLPEVRATYEPLAVTFSMKNPLGLEIELMEMQLVASLACNTSGLVHTSEFSAAPKKAEETISNDLTDEKEEKSWTFHGSVDEFRSPEFLCQLPVNYGSSPEVSSDASSFAIGPDSSNPYFVVTKPSVKMGPNSDARVSLKLCPLAEGDLRIRGVRFRLLGEVWMYHSFDLEGPLLQDTRVNRSKRVRGESLILRSKVEQKMPSLKVTIAPDNENTAMQQSTTTVLQGQTSRWKLTLSNLGYAPASNILLKTNAPWLNMTPTRHFKDDDVEINGETTIQNEENSPTSFCVGPSGTLMRVPLSKNADHYNPLVDILQPGETVDVPIAIRTSGGGRQDFYMLFRYELWSNNSNTVPPSGSSVVPPRHRWARKLLSVPVYPSITMSASLMPSYSNKGEHILSVELMNYRSDRDSELEIYLNKICVASRHFEVKQLRGQVNSSEFSQSLISTQDGSSILNPVVSPSSLKIGWQERVTLHYLVVPIETANRLVTFSNLSFSNGSGMWSDSALSKIRSHRYGAQVTDFMCRERAHEVFISTLQSHRIEKEMLVAEQEKEGQPRHVAQIRREKSSLPEQESNVLSSSAATSGGQHQSQIVSNSASSLSAHPTSLASLCPYRGGSNINIICCWSAVVGNEGRDVTIKGQHHLRDLLVRPLNKSKGCPLALTAKYNSNLSHNFDNGPLVSKCNIFDVVFLFRCLDNILLHSNC